MKPQFSHTDYLNELTETHLRDMVSRLFQSYSRYPESETQKAAQIEKARRDAYESGITEGIVALLHVERAKYLRRHLSLIGNMPTLNNYSVYRLVHQYHKRWQMATHVSTQYNKTAEAKDAVLNETLADLMQLAIASSIVELEEDARKQYVRAGLEKPIPSDVDWLKAEQEELLKQANPYSELLAAIDDKKEDSEDLSSDDDLGSLPAHRDS